MKTYTFHVSIPGTGRVWRKIEMRADHTLHDLHRAIQQAYKWSADHLYAFYMSGKAYDQRTEYRPPEGWTPIFGGDAELPDDDEDEAEPTPQEFAEALYENLEQRTPYELLEALVHEVLGNELSPDQQSVIDEFQASEKFDPWQKTSLRRFVDSFTTLPPGNTLTTRLRKLNLIPKQEFLYLFDFGDDWRFKARVYAINENAPEDEEYPRIVESVGEAPAQYPAWDDEDDY